MLGERGLGEDSYNLAGGRGRGRGWERGEGSHNLAGRGDRRKGWEEGMR